MIGPDRARRMRMAATLLLVAMACLFVAARLLERHNPAWGYLRAFAEAAMVGGLADWFAVTALFRRPLGLPIPHTAIIPENKNRIADTMAGFLRDNFLTPAVIARRMSAMNLAKAAGDFLAQGRAGSEGRIRAGAAELFADVLDSLDPERMGNQVRGVLARQADKLEVSPLLGKALHTSLADDRHKPLIDAALRWAGAALEANEDLVRTMIHARANAVMRWTGLDSRLSQSVMDGLYRLLAEVLVDPHHPMRAKLEEALQSLAYDMQHKPETRAKIEGIKAELLANPAVADWWMGVWEKMRLGLVAMARNPDEALSGQLGEALQDLGKSLQTDAALQVQINRFARRTAVGLTNRYGAQIVTLVSDTVRRWDARTITDRLESAVGRDLQFIRMNGTLVGGLVGLALYSASHWW